VAVGRALDAVDTGSHHTLRNDYAAQKS
jgi:hypothetical protein